MPDASQPDADDNLYAPPLQAWREEGHGRRIAPDAVWAAVRDDYLAGMSAPDVCERHGVRLRAMRDRAAREGWRRIDQPWAPRNRLDPDDEGVELEARVGGDLNKIEMRELAYVAVQRMMRAVLRGDAAGALRWRRVRDAMDAEEAEEERALEQHEAIWEARQGYARSDAPDAADALHASHALHGVSDPAAPDARGGAFGAVDAPERRHFPDPESRDTVRP